MHMNSLVIEQGKNFVLIISIRLLLLQLIEPFNTYIQTGVSDNMMDLFSTVRLHQRINV